MSRTDWTQLTNLQTRSLRTADMTGEAADATMGGVNPIRRLRAVSSPPTGRDASAALADAAHGDEAAFGEFYELCAPMVYGIVRRVVRDPSMSEEVTQEVFVELWRLAPRYDESKGSAKSWAATMAHRRAVDRVRSEEARRTRDDREANERRVVVDGPGDGVAAAVDREVVAETLASLSPSQREAITLAYYEGHSYREVAALLDVPEGTVKTRIRDGLIKLRDHIGGGP